MHFPGHAEPSSYVFKQTTLHLRSSMPERLVSYLRVSTARQGASGLGLEAQRQAVADYAARSGATLAAEHIEVESGRLKDRPVLNEALAACRRLKGKLVIAKLDRLARNVHFVSGLTETGVGFVACDMPEATPFIIHVMASVAQLEREQIAERTKAALAAAKARGVRLGVHGAVLAAAHKAEAEAFAQTLASPVAEARRSGAGTLMDIATALNRRGLRTREDAAWSPGTVSRLVRRLDA